MTIYHQIKLIKLGIQDLQNCISLDLKTLKGMWNKEQWKEELTNSQKICFGIYKENLLIGFACGHIVIDEINITILAIMPSYQRIGLGGILIDHLLKEANKSGALIAKLEVKENNLFAKSFYKKNSFKQIGLRKKLYKDGSNAIIFQRLCIRNC